MITRKKLTKLLDGEFRNRIINSMSEKRQAEYRIPQMARYIVDSCIVNRSEKHENDKNYGYGYSPIQCLGVVLDDGSVDTRFFEFNSVNHFLREKDGDTAVDVVKAILVEWTRENKHIKVFDVDRIDMAFAKVEAEYVERRKREEAAKDENAESGQEQ